MKRKYIQQNDAQTKLDHFTYILKNDDQAIEHLPKWHLTWHHEETQSHSNQNSSLAQSFSAHTSASHSNLWWITKQSNTCADSNTQQTSPLQRDQGPGALHHGCVTTYTAVLPTSADTARLTVVCVSSCKATFEWFSAS